MTRPPTDKLPQRRLLDLLRVEIERSMASGKPTRRLVRLVEENPHSVWSTHVAYNLSRVKFLWLFTRFALDEGLARARAPLPFRHEAARSLRSAAEIERWIQQLEDDTWDT